MLFNHGCISFGSLFFLIVNGPSKGIGQYQDYAGQVPVNQEYQIIQKEVPEHPQYQQMPSTQLHPGQQQMQDVQHQNQPQTHQPPGQAQPLRQMHQPQIQQNPTAAQGQPMIQQRSQPTHPEKIAPQGQYQEKQQNQQMRYPNQPEIQQRLAVGNPQVEPSSQQHPSNIQQNGLTMDGQSSQPSDSQEPPHLSSLPPPPIPRPPKRPEAEKIYPKGVYPGYAQGPATKIQTNPNDITDLDLSMPGSMIDFNIYVGSGKEDCYWQYVKSNATFYVSVTVLKGGDGSIGLGVRQPNGKIALPYRWLPDDEYMEEETQEGYYCVCLDNLFSKSGATLVQLYIDTFHFGEMDQFNDFVNVRKISFLF